MSLIKIHGAAISRPIVFYSLFINCLQKTLEMFIIARIERPLNLRPQPLQRSKVLKCQVFLQILCEQFVNIFPKFCEAFCKLVAANLQKKCTKKEHTFCLFCRLFFSKINGIIIIVNEMNELIKERLVHNWFTFHSQKVYLTTPLKYAII